MLEEVGGLTVGGWGRRNRLKCLKKGERENGKRGCRNKIFKNVGYRGGCLKREGGDPLTNYGYFMDSIHEVHIAWTGHLFSNATFLWKDQVSYISLFQTSLNLLSLS